MIKTQVICDFCERPVPLHPMEIDGKIYEEVAIDLARTKVYNTRDLFPHLCKSCAARIDAVLIKYKTSISLQAELCAKFAKANEERKERLGTKG